MGLGAEGRMSEQRVAVQREKLEGDRGNEQARLDPSEVTDGAPERGDERENEEVHDQRKDHPAQGLQHFPIVRRDITPGDLTTVGP